MQPLPKIVVFRCHQMPPAPRLQVRIRSDTDIGPVHMRVRSVGVDQVCQSKPLRHRSVVFDEGVYIDYAGDRTITILGQGELLNQPICWYLAIGICVRQPTALARSFVAFQGNFSCEGTGSPDTTCIRLDYDPITLNQVFGDIACSVG
jgi:hypothetical protein